MEEKKDSVSATNSATDLLKQGAGELRGVIVGWTWLGVLVDPMSAVSLSSLQCPLHQFSGDGVSDGPSGHLEGCC